MRLYMKNQVKGIGEMKKKQEVLGKIFQIESMIRRYEKKGDFFNGNLLKRDLHILNWVLEDE